MEVKLRNSLNWGSPSEKFKSTEKNLRGHTEAFMESVTAHNSQPRKSQQQPDQQRRKSWTTRTRAGAIKTH